MKIGYHLTPFWSPAERTPSQNIDEAIEVVSASSSMGYEWVSMGQHWLSHPTAWPQPYPFLARVAPVTGSMKLKTSIVLLPLHNAIDVAENMATLDNISHGRLVIGVGLGYREDELAAVGLGRKDRVPKLEESINVMKQLWSGSEISYEGKYVKVDKGQMGMVPYQKPHPPIEMSAQSEAATRRAAKIGDAVFFGPQVAWRDVAHLVDVYREARTECGDGKPGTVGASRSLMVGTSKEDAARSAEKYLEKTFQMYKGWKMNEAAMVQLQLDASISLDDWAIHGSPADCVETILRSRDDIGLEGIGFTIYNLPPEPQARIDYLQMISEEILAKVVS